MKRTLISLAAAAAMALSAAAQMNGQVQQQPNGWPQQQPTAMGQPTMPGFQTPGQQVNYSKLSGRWMLSTQHGNDQMPWQMQVSPNGQFQGTQGKARMTGKFNGQVAQAQFASVDLRTGKPLPPGRVQLQFDGGCHVQMVMYGPPGSQPYQGTFHVNHQAGQPCPR